MRIIRADTTQGFRIVAQATPDVPSKQFAHQVVASIISDDKRWKGNASGKPYAQAVYELFSTAEIDSVDFSDAAAVDRFGRQWYQGLATSGQATATIEIPPAVAANNQTKIALATALRDKPELSLFAGRRGYLSDRLDKIKAVYDASRELRSMFASMPASAVTEVERNVGLIQQEVISRYSREPSRVTTLMSEGFAAGKRQTATIQTNGQVRATADEIEAGLHASVPSEYISEARTSTIPDRDALVQFAQNLLVTVFIAVNADVLVDRAGAIQLMLRCEGFLNAQHPLGSNWRGILRPEYQKELKKFTTISPDADKTEKHTAKAYIREITSVFGQVRDTKGVPDDIPQTKAGFILNDQGDYAEMAVQYARHAVSDVKEHMWPNLTSVVPKVAEAVLAALCAAAYDVERNPSKMAEMHAAAWELSQLWPNWKEVVGRMRPQEDSPLYVLREKEGRRTPRDRIHTGHFEQMFSMAYGKVKELVLAAIQASKSEMCADGNNSLICDGYRDLLEGMNTDQSILSKPKFVAHCFADENGKTMATGADFQQADTIIQDYAIVEETEDIDDAAITKMVDAMLIQVQRWGSSINDQTEDYEPKDEWMYQDGADVSGRFKERHSSPEEWGKPGTIVFASMLLWLLSGKSRGKR